MKRWKRRPTIPLHACPCGVKVANYASFLGLRCARCRRRLHEKAKMLHPELKDELLFGLGCGKNPIPPETLDHLTSVLLEKLP